MTKHLPLINFIGCIVIFICTLCGYKGNMQVLAFNAACIALDAYLADMRLRKIKGAK